MLPRLTPILCLFTAPVLAQPIIQGPQSLPYAGFEHTWIQADSFVEATEQGANVVWDFSLLTPEWEMTSQWGMVTFNQEHYPYATLQHQASAYDWWTTSGDSLYCWGRHTIMNIESYQDPRLELRLPMNFGDAWSDGYQGESEVSPVISGACQAEVTGFGTLILPYGTVQDVLRLDLIDACMGTTSSGTPTETRIDSLTRYYKQGLPWCLLEVQKHLRITTQTVSHSRVFYTSDDMISGASNIAFRSRFARVFPNPATEWLSIAGITSQTRARISDSMGKTVRDLVINDISRTGLVLVDLRGLPAGLYSIGLEIGGHFEHSLFVVQ